jgi:alpha-mannosidase
MPAIDEILVLHGTHTDIGYTHPRSTVWTLHRRFIDRALDFCDDTADRPDDQQFRWTCECTWPLLNWWRRAGGTDRDRFRDAVARGQMGAMALPMHLTPLSNAWTLSEGFRAVDELREETGLPLRTAAGNDVNGLPWPIVSLLHDRGIDLLIMGINVAVGGHPLTRPLPFTWEGPDGRSAIAFNGEHYNLFHVLARTHLRSTDAAQEGLEAYIQTRIPEDWPLPFIVLSATHSFACDNNPPSRDLCDLARQWNAEGRTPRIRMALPEELCDRFLAIRSSLPVHRGDWTDAWNFGCASTARATDAARRARARLAAGRRLESVLRGPTDPERADEWERAIESILVFEEHTWVGTRSSDLPHSDLLQNGWHEKAGAAWNALARASYAMREALEEHAGNADREAPLTGLTLVNTTGSTIRTPIPLTAQLACSLRTAGLNERETEESAAGEHWWTHLLPHRHQLEHGFPDALDTGTGVTVGPFEIPPYGTRDIPIAVLREAVMEPPHPLDTKAGKLESPWMTLSFDAATGRIDALDSGPHGRVLEAGVWPIFGYVHEHPDPLYSDRPFRGREAIYEIDWTILHRGGSTWNPNWAARRCGPSELLALSAQSTPYGEELRLAWRAPGVDELRQRILLSRDRPEAVFEMDFVMTNTITPEAVYAVWPTTLAAGWRAHYDTADLPVEIDREQLPGCTRDFITAGSWVCLSDERRALTLACPSAPLFQIGDFSFGRRKPTVPRDPNPLLLGWPANNYWHTNFAPSQPGLVRVRYVLRVDDAFDPGACARFAESAECPVERHPLTRPCESDAASTWLEVEPDSVRVLSARPTPEGTEWWLSHPGDAAIEARLRFPGRAVHRARCLDRTGAVCEVRDGALIAGFPPRTLRRILVQSGS